MAILVFDVEVAAEIVAEKAFGLETEELLVMNVELGSDGRVVEHGTGLRLGKTDPKTLPQGPALEGKAPMFIDRVFERVVDGKDDLETPVFAKRMVEPDNGIDPPSMHPAVAQKPDVVMPIGADLISPPGQAGKKAVRGRKMLLVDVVVGPQDPTPFVEGGGIKSEGELPIIETGLVEFRIAVPIHFECVPFDAGEKVGSAGDRDEELEEGVLLIEYEIPSVRMMDVGAAEENRVPSRVERVEVPITVALVFLVFAVERKRAQNQSGAKQFLHVPQTKAPIYLSKAKKSNRPVSG